MGQTLSEPITEKYTTHGEDSRYVYAASAMQGWRVTMEDAHTTLLDISEGENPGTNAPAFFAVFDGHGGQGSAIYAGKHLHHFIRKRPEFAEKKYDAAIKAGYLETDEHLRQSFSTVQDPSGCTAVSVVIPGDGKIYCGNAGDSRCVLSSGGKAIPLSMDHKPTNDIEYQRITQGGGFVEFGRVNGNLALSRAIGDFEFKNNPALSPEKQVVTADPDVSVHELSTDDQFFVVACDGIWDCMTNVEVTDMVRELVAAGVELTTVCEKIMERCLARESEFGGLGCDNMTIVIVALLQGKSKQEWAEAVKQSLETVPITPKDPKQDATPDEAEVSFGIDRSQKFGFSASESDSDHDEAEGMGRNSKIIRIGDYQVLTFDRKNTGRVIEEYDYEDEDEDEVEEDISSDDSSGNVIKKNVVKEAKHAGQQAHAIVADIKSPDDSENPKELLSTPASINTSAD